MSRPKGVKNLVAVVLPDICTLSPEERIEFLANLMIDRILDDQATGKKLFRKVKGLGYADISSNR